MNKGQLIEIERETENTRQLLSRLKEEHFSYKPHEKSMSLIQLASHIVELHNWMKEALSGAYFDFPTMYKPFEAQSVQELLDVLNNGYAANVETEERRVGKECRSRWGEYS